MAVALVTDSTADLPPGTVVASVPSRIAFSDHNFSDDAISPAEFFARMNDRCETPRPSAPTEDEWREAFTLLLAEGGSVTCLLTPFDMVPSFTTANAAAVTLKPEPVRIVNAGVASAGLGALLLTLADGVGAGWDEARLLAAIDDLVPQCDTMFVPADPVWLERAGRLGLIEDRIGALEGDFPVVRAATRLTGVARGRGFDAALEELAGRVGQRAGEGTPLVAVVDHAGDEEAAARLADMLAARWKIDRVVTTQLSPTYGSQLGPGTVGVGVAPVAVV